MRLSYEGDQTAADFWLGKAQQELGRLRSRMEIGQREQGAFAHALSDTAYVYGGILPGGYEWVHIVASPGVDATPPPVALFKPTTPDFISGLCLDNRIEAPADATKNRPYLKAFAATDSSIRMHPGELPARNCHPERLAVDASPTFSSLAANDKLHFAQTRYCVPTNYSGKMRAVVQALLGFGKRTGKITKDGVLSIYDIAKPKLAQEKPGPVKPQATKWESAVLKDGLQQWYDFRWARTHGITTAADGALWLVEISAGRGIVAMPLPLWPLTTTPEFYDKVAGMGDDEALAMIDELGGFPTGEHFPTSAVEFDAYVKAGRIVKLASKDDLAPFYANIPYGSGVGWAFNVSGSEAHNTAYNYNGFSGHQLGVHYACTLQIGPTRDFDAGSEMQKAERKARRNALKAKFDTLRSKFADTFEVVLWKIDHADDSELLTMEAAIGSLTDKFQELLDMALAPLASGMAHCGKMGEGFLWSTAKPIGQPQIKFPEVAQGYIVSHDFRPLNPADEGARIPVLCDTTMFVFFKDEEIVPVKFYYNPQVHEHEHEDDFEECMYEGEWSWRDSSGRRIPAGFYTPEYDDRHEIDDSSFDQHIVGVDLGWVTYQNADDPGAPYHGWSSRTRGYMHTVTTVATYGAWWQNAIAIPLHDREAYYYAYLEGFTYRNTTSGTSYKTLGDPNFGEYYRKFPGYSAAQYPSNCGAIGRDRKIVELLHDDGPCNDLVDEGPWLHMCQDVENLPWAMDLPAIPETVTIEGQTKHRRVYFSCSSEDFPELLLDERTRSDPDTPYWTGGLWFINSPDEFGNYQAIYATRNSLGAGNLTFIEREPNGGEWINKGGPQLVADKSPGYTFVGVINA